MNGSRQVDVIFQSASLSPTLARMFAEALEARAREERIFFQKEMDLLKARLNQFESSVSGCKAALVMLTMAIAIAVCYQQSLFR